MCWRRSSQSSRKIFREICKFHRKLWGEGSQSCVKFGDQCSVKPPSHVKCWMVALCMQDEIQRSSQEHWWSNTSHDGVVESLHNHQGRNLEMPPDFTGSFEVKAANLVWSGRPIFFEDLSCAKCWMAMEIVFCARKSREAARSTNDHSSILIMSIRINHWFKALDLLSSFLYKFDANLGARSELNKEEAQIIWEIGETKSNRRNCHQVAWCHTVWDFCFCWWWWWWWWMDG